MGKIREIRKDPHGIGAGAGLGAIGFGSPLSLLANLANEPAAGAAREWATLKRDMAAKMRGPRYGGLTRRQVETLIRRYQAGHIDVGTFLFVYAWRHHLDRETTPSPLLLRAGDTYFAQVIGAGRVDLAKELVKALTFLADRKVGDIGKVDFGYSHWWKLCLLHYMLNHPKDRYRTGELHA